jgi:DNA-binding IclR family transcriptional regulator
VACDREESIRGGICFGAAIQAPGKPVKAAISVSTPTTRMDAVREKETRSAVLEAAAEIGRRL